MPNPVSEIKMVLGAYFQKPSILQSALHNWKNEKSLGIKIEGDKPVLSDTICQTFDHKNIYNVVFLISN